MKTPVVTIEASLRTVSKVTELLRDVNLEKIYEVNIEQTATNVWIVRYNEDEMEHEVLCEELLMVFHDEGIFEVEVN